MQKCIDHSNFIQRRNNNENEKGTFLFLALLTVVTMFSFGTVDAYAATQVYKAKGYLWSEDMFEDEFSVNSKQKIKFEFSCQVPAYVSVYSLDTFNDVLYKENTKSLLQQHR